jgi:hypothetical protein
MWVIPGQVLQVVFLPTMQTTIGRYLPAKIPEKPEHYALLKYPAIHACSRCTRPIEGGQGTKDIRPCVMTMTSLEREKCDYCHKNNKTCDGQFYSARRLLWMLSRNFREQGWHDPDVFQIYHDDENITISVGEFRAIVQAQRDAE